MKSLTDKHQKSSVITSRYGGKAEDGGIESVTHIEDLGNGKADVVIEHRQNEAPALEFNQMMRNEGQKKVTDKGFVHKMLANVTLQGVMDWKNKYGWDLRRANLNDPEQRMFFEYLLSLYPQYKV